MAVPLSFVYRSQQGASLVEVAGSFNNWTPVPMTRGPWEWTISIKLAPGQYQYKYMEDNEWRHDKDKPTQNDNMGNLNNIITVEKKDDEDTVEFKSNGDAGIHRKTRMGTYIKTDQLSRGRPVFEQAIQEKGEKKYFLFIGPDGCWRVGPDITSYSGSLLKHPKKTPNLPPKSGWCYYLNDKWNQDDSLQVIVNVKNDPGKTFDGTQTSRQPSQDVKTAVLDAIEADAAKIKSTGRWDDETTVDECKETFMEMDEDVNFNISLFGHTPLMVAAEYGFEEVCKVLISAGADPNKINRTWGVKETALMFAAQAGWPEVCEILLSAGAAINQRNHEGYGKTALDIAKEHENTGVVEVLEKHGATASQIELAQILDFHGISLSEIDKQDEEKNGSTPLLFAVREGNKDACRLMIEAGADVNIIDGSGITALMVAAENGLTEIFKMLLEARADIEKQNEFMEYQKSPHNTALHLCSSDGHGDIAKMLIAAGADIKKRNANGETALYLASSKGSTEIVKMLIKEGADLDVAETGTRKGFTPLIKAAKEGYTEVCRLLIEAGASVDKEMHGRCVGQTALLWAVLDRHTETSTLLIKAGASIQKVTNLEMDYDDWGKESQQWLAKLGEELGQE